MDNKKNCWEIMNCGRQPGDEKVNEYGLCPALADNSKNSINGGINAGRYCWTVASTFCIQGNKRTFTKKMSTCMECNFFKQVKAEEDLKFVFNDLQFQMKKSLKTD